MEILDIILDVTNTHKGLVQNTSWGEVGLFYNPDQNLKKDICLLTFKAEDGKNDSSSNLNRAGVYRINIGISKDTFTALFGVVPKRPRAGGVVEMSFNFAELDSIMPHPVYGWMCWVCVLNPSTATYGKLKPLIAEGYHLALGKYGKRVGG